MKNISYIGKIPFLSILVACCLKSLYGSHKGTEHKYSAPLQGAEVLVRSLF